MWLVWGFWLFCDCLAVFSSPVPSAVVDPLSGPQPLIVRTQIEQTGVDVERIQQVESGQDHSEREGVRERRGNEKKLFKLSKGYSTLCWLNMCIVFWVCLLSVLCWMFRAERMSCVEYVCVVDGQSVFYVSLSGTCRCRLSSLLLANGRWIQRKPCTETERERQQRHQ